MANALAHSTSPYLQQHKDNPVQWLEWKQESLEVALRENKPILLSIGYAACHWCHVMAHESFEDPTTASLMNELFVNIKVDREERPDIDQIYMAALHAMGQPGGWPLTMFLTPLGEAFWGGTYFPSEASHGRPAFKDILTRVSDIFHSQPEQIRNNVEQLRSAVSTKPFVSSQQDISDAQLTDFAKRLYSHMDSQYGGIQGAPKFPNTQILELFFRRGHRTGIESLSGAAIKALEGMCSGGIRDHIGGGFARYSVDEKWFVPHFEKMLYDNAQILTQLCIADEITGRARFRIIAEELVDWLQREMIADDGMFASSLDADSDHVEGKYYCWTAEELAEVLTPSELALFKNAYRIETDGNWTEHHTGLRTNVIHQIGSPHNLCDSEQLSTIKKKLQQARSSRIPPGRDDKILADWNGLMITALARAGSVFGRKDWVILAETALQNLVEAMAEKQSGELHLAHSKRGPKLLKPGMASDYAFLIHAALTLHDCGSDSKFQPAHSNSFSCISLAQHLARTLIKYYADPETGVLSLARRDASDIIYRYLVTTDDAVPNPNSIFLQSLQILESFEEDNQFSQQSKKMMRSITPRALEQPFGHASFLNALDDRMNRSEIFVMGANSAHLLDVARKSSFLNRFVVDSSQLDEPIPSRFNFGSSARAYLCRGQTCSLPITEAAELEALVNERKER